MYQNCIIPYLYEAQHVSGDIPPIIRSLKLHWQPLVFHMWKAVGRVVGVERPKTYVFETQTKGLVLGALCPPPSEHYTVISGCEFPDFLWGYNSACCLIWCETLSLTLAEKHRLRVFEKRVLRKVLRPPKAFNDQPHHQI